MSEAPRMRNATPREVSEEATKIDEQGYVETRAGRYFIRCASPVEGGICRLRLNHASTCSRDWK